MQIENLRIVVIKTIAAPSANHNLEVSMLSRLALLIVSSILLGACAGQDLTQRRSNGSDSEEEDSLSLASSEQMSANVDNFYVTISVGRDGILLAPCRTANFRVVSNAEVKLIRGYWGEANYDDAKQIDAQTIEVSSKTINGRDGLLLMVKRGAELKIEDAGDGLKRCDGSEAPKSMALDLSALNSDLFAPARTDLFGKSHPFTRVQKFYSDRFSLRATFRIGGSELKSLGVED